MQEAEEGREKMDCGHPSLDETNARKLLSEGEEPKGVETTGDRLVHGLQPLAVRKGKGRQSILRLLISVKHFKDRTKQSLDNEKRWGCRVVEQRVRGYCVVLCLELTVRLTFELQIDDDTTYS